MRGAAVALRPIRFSEVDEGGGEGGSLPRAFRAGGKTVALEFKRGLPEAHGARWVKPADVRNDDES